MFDEFDFREDDKKYKTMVREVRKVGILVQIKRRLGEFELDVQLHGKSNRIGILGTSGCGKSVTLKSIAGIEKPEKGLISVNGKVFFDSAVSINIRPQERKTGYLFQNYALFPSMSVAENIKVGLKGTKEERKRRVEEMMEKFQISEFADRMPGSLSGGQQQRAALARIMAYEPDIILLDEPFSALDMFLKDRLQKEMEEMLAEYPGIVIMVSHSRDEIYRFSDELLIMDKGHSVVYGKTKEIFSNPIYREAARLTGCKNIVNFRKLNDHTICIDDWGLAMRMEKKIPKDVTYIGYRAHDFVPVWGVRKENCLKIKLDSMAELPFENQYYLFPEKNENDKNISWFVQRDWLSVVKERGLPDYLQIKEDKLMFLK